jgi:hypothetical protein
MAPYLVRGGGGEGEDLGRNLTGLKSSSGQTGVPNHGSVLGLGIGGGGGGDGGGSN